VKEFPEHQLNRFLADIERTPDGPPIAADFVRLDRNEHVGPLPEAVVTSILAGVTPAMLSEYPTTWPLSRRLAERLEIPVDHLVLVPGSDAAIRSLCHVLVSPGDIVAALDPSYAMYPVYARMFGGVFLPVPVRADLAADMDALRSACRRAKVVFLANPNQPSGGLLDPETVLELARRAQDSATILVVDEAYYPFSGSTVLPAALALPNVAVVRTFSKAYGLAGLRLGFVAGAPALVRALFKVRHSYDINAFVLHVAGRMLDRAEIVDDFVAQVGKSAALLQAVAASYALEAPPCHANFQLIRTGPRFAPAEVAARLRERRYLIKGPPGDGIVRDFIRITLGDVETTRGCAEALAAVLDEMGAVRTRA
jgi:histidinol-phosphate aminotransferase